MNDLFENNEILTGPVECLGLVFANDAARREHFLGILSEKLKDPEFRNIEGFPIGTDEDILNLSDPPYYTACPNPFIAEFIEQYGKPYDSSVPYSKEPFAADVSEGKNDPIYNAHSYHTKVPHKAIMRYILHYTQPGEIVLDGFCGTGMTGVAAQLCGDKFVVESLGYRVEGDGSILEPEEENGRTIWKPFSKLGARRAIINDLSPVATFIAYNYNTPIDVYSFDREVIRILAEVEEKFGWMYTTIHSDNKTNGRINYTVWSDVFNCPECTFEVVFWNEALDQGAGKVRDDFQCPHCSAALNKRNMERTQVTKFDSTINAVLKQAKQVPVLINYTVGNTRFEKIPDAEDFLLLEKIESEVIQSWIPSNKLPDGYNTRQPIESHGATHTHHYYTRRNSLALSLIWELIEKSQFSRSLKFVFTSAHQYVNRLCRLHVGNHFTKKGGTVDKPLGGTLYFPSIAVEVDPIKRFQLRARIGRSLTAKKQTSIITTQSLSGLLVKNDSLDYIFIDPPFGANINYSELNFLWESWLKIVTTNTQEAVQNPVQGKSLDDYRHIMTSCLREAYRVLKPGRWVTIEFSNTQAAVWNAIQTSLQEAGFVVANVSAIDKKKGSFKAVTTTTAVKQDLVISAYKPNGGLEDRFVKSGGGEDSVWDFVRTHLKYLPSVKLSEGQLEFIAERDPRIIFDRMVAWFVRHNFPVPLSSQEFQAGLAQRFSDRDGMVFLPEQTTEYDRKRLQTAQAPQMEMFIADERSAIDWLTDFLKKKPTTYQEIQPEFMQQLGAGWKKHEEKPELSQLLDSNFFCYDPKARDGQEIPSQIHSYLSSNFKELRGLEKSDPALRAKAADRWFVPDPNKAQELEKLREKSLLKEFDIYKAFTGRKMKEFRLEVLRAGFKSCWVNKDYATITAVAKKVPDNALQEDEKLLLWYDQALTRMENDV